MVRREFVVGAGVVVGGVVGALGCRRRERASPSSAPPRERERARDEETRRKIATSPIPRRPLGRTGATVSLVGLGGYHLGKVDDERESIRIIHAALDRGIDFLDNCWDYHEGKSEERMGKALAAPGRRDQAFLMTKIDGRTKKAATEQLEQSLQRLKTDRIDLVQIHEVIRASDPGRVFASDGTIEALVEARKAGKVRFLGFTGHKDPGIHRAMLDEADRHKFVFDTVQMPLNVLDAQHARSFEKEVLPILVDKGIGVLGMKPLAAGKIPEKKVASAIECLHYAMHLPTSVVITGCDSIGTLEQAIEAAVTFAPMDPPAVARLLAQARPFAADGKLEEFKTTTKHDGTIEHPQWLESANI